MSSQFLSDPRQESFIQMLHYSVCPLFKRNTFTYYICILDIIYYILMLICQQQYHLTLRPHQKIIFNFGQLHPNYIYDIWRFIFSLEQHKNETHLFFSILFKLHFFSFIEYINGFKNTLLIYIISGISSTLFQVIISKDIGVCGSFHIGIICYAIYLQQQLLLKCSPQQQLQFYYSSQDFNITIIKLFIVLSIIFIISIKFKGILLTGCIMFTIQSMILGQYVQYEQKKQQQQLQLINSIKQSQIKKYFYLGSSLLLLMIEIIILWYFQYYTQN